MKRIFSILLLLGISMPLAAASQDFVAENVPNAQALLKDFTCPDGANPQACLSFKQLVDAGDNEALSSFTLLFDKAAIDATATYVVFDANDDHFWIVSSWMVLLKDHTLHVITNYQHYQNGLEVNAVAWDIQPALPIASSLYFPLKDGVSLSTNNGSLSSQETCKGLADNLVTINIDVQRSTLSSQIVWRVGNNVSRYSGTALHFQGENIPRTADKPQFSDKLSVPSSKKLIL